MNLMKKLFISLTIIIVTLLLLSSCGKAEEQDSELSDLSTVVIKLNNTNIAAKEISFTGRVAEKRTEQKFLEEEADIIAACFKEFIDAGEYSAYNYFYDFSDSPGDIVTILFPDSIRSGRAPEKVFLCDHFIKESGYDNSYKQVYVSTFPVGNKYNPIQFVTDRHKGTEIPQGGKILESDHWRGFRLICEWDDNITTEYYFVLKNYDSHIESN